MANENSSIDGSWTVEAVKSTHDMKMVLRDKGDAEEFAIDLRKHGWTVNAIRSWIDSDGPVNLATHEVRARLRFDDGTEAISDPLFGGTKDYCDRERECLSAVPYSGSKKVASWEAFVLPVYTDVT